MKEDDINTIFEREKMATEIKNLLAKFDQNRDLPTFKKGFYIYGSPGSGKTTFVTRLLKEMDYDVIKYDAGDVRNKSLIDTITSNNISNRNVLHMMSKRVKKIAIVMDEIDGMNNGDKGGITALIKMIRQKKTKKQRLENMTMNPIICIGNYFKWDPNAQTEVIKEKYGWKASDKEFQRTYRKMSNLDDRYENGAHDLLKFIKFGSSSKYPQWW